MKKDYLNESEHEIMKGGKLMKTKKILISGFILALATICLGTSVQAAGFTSRILQKNSLNLGEAIGEVRLDNSRGTTTSSEFDGYASRFAENPNLTVPLTRGDVIGMHNFFCIEPTVELPTSSVDYVADGKIINIESKKGSSEVADVNNSINSYIISARDELAGDAGKEFYQKVVQSAVWMSTLTESDKSSTVGRNFYESAKAYADYIKRYKEPALYSSSSQTKMLETGEYLVGPYRLNYTTSHYNDIQFGQVTGITIKDSMGNNLTRGTDWELTDSTGRTVITETEYNDTQSYIEDYNFPKNGQEFYIKIRAGLNASTVKMTVGFNTIEATGHYIKLKGTKEVQAGSSTVYCETCKPYIDAHDYVEIDGEKYHIEKVTKYAMCGRRVQQNISKDGKPLPSSVSPAWKTLYCGKGTAHVATGKYLNGQETNYRDVTCGEKYTIAILNPVTNGIEGTSQGTAACRQYLVRYTVNEYKKLGCGETVSREYTVYSKTSQRFEYQSELPCGYTSSWRYHITETQELIYAWGERTNTEVEVTADILLETVDLSLRKFITAINGEPISNSREPQVDVSPLKNGKTTAKYNHPKSLLTVKLGDEVTYTIRVYNEGTTDAYAKEVKDYLPTNMEFVSATVDGVNYGWKTSTVNGRTVITTSYLADKKLEKYHTINKDDYREQLDYVDLKLIARVKTTAAYDEKLINIAEISKYAYQNNKGNVIEIATDVDSTANNIKLPSKEKWPEYYGAGIDGNYVKGQEDDDDFEGVRVLLYVDLSLRKFITAVNGEQITTREPQVDISPLKNGGTTAKYNHTKAVLDVAYEDEVTYTIRVYNEGNAAGYALEVKDYLPTDMEFVSATVDGIDYGWKTSVENGRTVITTNYLQNKVIDRYYGGDKLDYEDLKLICKVKNTAKINEILLNISEISKYGVDVKGKAYVIASDRDSTANDINLPQENAWSSYYGSGEDGNYVKGQEDDDDFERVSVRITDIGGTVWLDGLETKQQRRDDRLNTGSNTQDVMLENILVTLLMKNDNGEFVVNDTQKTDSNGNYKFVNKLIGREYIVKFEYFGQQYMQVAYVDPYSQEYSADCSMAQEKKEERDALNDKFHKIVNGKAQNSAGEYTIELNYNRNERTKAAVLVRDDAFNNKTLINAYTVAFKGSDSFVNHINFGIYERPQTDLAIMTDIKEATLAINGLEEVKPYNGRREEAAMDINVKLEDDYNKVYDVDLFRSDYNFRIADYNQDDTVTVPAKGQELEVYITYKIRVQNNSTKTAALNELKMYYAPEYNLVESWYSEAEKVEWATGGEEHGFKTMTTKLSNDITLNSGDYVYVYVKFQVAKNNNGEITLGEKYVVTEITAYTSPEGLIDMNSEPGNTSVENWEKYEATREDDTDKAPGVNVRIGDQTRTMTGFVWEDLESATETENNNGVKIGNGVYEQGEKKQNGVTVQLIELVEIDGKTYEYIWQETKTGSDKVSYMDRTGTRNDGNHARTVNAVSGTYTFSDYIPGKYIVRFIYGENLNANKEVILSGQEYKETKYKGYGDLLSSAKDNKVRRLEVMNNANSDNADLNNSEWLRQNAWMNADTVEVMTIGVAEATHASNVNFGLIKRPIAKLTITKEIEAVKITDTAGQPLVDTDQEKNDGVRKFGTGEWEVDVDDELINGAVFEARYRITVTNDSEKDTLYNYFEGEQIEGVPENQNVEIKTAAEIVYDKPQKMGFSSQAGWEKLDGTSELIIATKELGKFLGRGESVSMPITLSKILATGNDDNLETVNIALLAKGVDSSGRTIETDEGEATITVTDPAGKARVHYEIWILAAAMFVVGVVAIKMLVLKKK
ncbi:MAG: DUF11 domain-containing protein [Clostridia bacterium]|nr:DUF11 domain-containing protein [Clostridia bacterium]